MKKWFKTLNRKNSDSIKWDWAQEECQGTECYLFSIADSDYETAPAVKEAMQKRVEHGAFGYVNKGMTMKRLFNSGMKNDITLIFLKRRL